MPFSHRTRSEEEPAQQLWVFWICPVLAAAVVALVVIVAGMIGTKKNVPDTVETIDEVEGNTVLGESSVADGNDGEQDEQSYAQANADESVESN